MGLIVDNFAGGGGASTGIRAAIGRDPDLAVNHDYEALVMYRENHPNTKVYCDDVFKVDPLKVTQGEPVELAWFSPDCKHFSKAKGGKPKSKKIRGLAWVMVKWAATVRPTLMFLENVEEFQTWGPLLEDGSTCPHRKGVTFRNFVARLTNLGYQVEWRELRACDYGAPTIRKRLFLIARCDGLPITWPAPTHGRPESPEVKSGLRKPWRTAAECIDFTIPCPSIFEREKELAEATKRRIARGIRKFVTESEDPFIVRIAHGDVSPAGVKRWGSGEHSIHEPLGTVPASNEFAVVSPTLIQTGYGERKGQRPRAPGLQKPLGTAVGGGQKHAIVEAKLAPFLTEHANGSSQRVFSEAEPLRTQCGEVKGGHFAQVCAFLAKHYGGHETPGAAPVQPFAAITAKDHHAVVAAHVVRHFGQSVGSKAKKPVGAICAGGMGKTGLVTSHLAKLYGTTTGQDNRGPMHTVTGQGNHIAEVRAFLIRYYGIGSNAASLEEPVHTLTAKDRIGLVTIHGEEYVITDIGMRMLEPRELYLAQGFPPDYKIAPKAWAKLGNRLVMRSLPKHAQVRMCGNSVPPPMSEALVRANYSPISEELAA